MQITFHNSARTQRFICMHAQLKIANASVVFSLKLVLEAVFAMACEGERFRKYTALHDLLGTICNYSWVSSTGPLTTRRIFFVVPPLTSITYNHDNSIQTSKLFLFRLRETTQILTLVGDSPLLSTPPESMNRDAVTRRQLHIYEFFPLQVAQAQFDRRSSQT